MRRQILLLPFSSAVPVPPKSGGKTRLYKVGGL